ncbi:MAG: glycosyltransferase family 39 protein, partial [Clostridia bacterium]|nr:glycosyltransferase family 39 protein [Clostridia bacterium]
NFKSGYVSKSANPLGVALTAIGVTLFGSSAFGVRIMGYLFMVATVYLLYFLAKKLFATNGYAIATVVLYIISGFALSLVTKSAVTLIANFFMIAAFNFTLNYYNRAKDGKSLRNNAYNLVLGGFMLSLAFCVTPYALFLLPALIAVCLIPSVKIIHAIHKTYIQAEGLEKEYAREKYSSTLRKFVFYGLFGFILLPIILVTVSYGVTYPMYTAFYGKNFFSAIFVNHARIFSNNGGSNFAGWVIGLGSSSTQNAFGTSTHLFANRVLCALSFIAILAIGVLYLLNAKNKIKDGHLIVALKENASTYFTLAISFASTWILNAILWNGANYANFAISLVFAILVLVLLHKLLKNSMHRVVLNSVTIGLITIIALFFVIQTPYIFNFDLPKKFMMIYNWLV